MIKSIEIENYKLFDRLKLDNMSAVNLVSGRNGVGKSTLLEAIYVHRDRLNPGVLMNHMAWRGAGRLWRPGSDVFIDSFHRFDPNLSIRICTREDDGNHEVTIRHPTQLDGQSLIVTPEDGSPGAPVMAPAAVYTIDDNGSPTCTHILSASVDSARRALSLRQQGSIKAPSHVAYFGTTGGVPAEVDSERFGKLEMQNEIPEIVEVLKVFEPQLRDIAAIPIGDTTLLYAEVGSSKNKFPVALLGTGFTRTLSVILGMGTVPGGLVLIDEVDVGLHHSVMKDVWKSSLHAAERFGCQIVATTHSFAFMQQIVEAEDEMSDVGFSFYRLSRGDSGSIQPIHLDLETFVGAVRNGLEIR